MPRSKHDQPEATSPTTAAHSFKLANRPGQLRVRYLDDPVIEVNLANGAAITFGRSRDANVVISDQSVSKVHFSLRAVAAGVELEDLGSKNGTWYSGRPVRRITLKPGDDFWAGGCHVELLAVEDVAVEIAADSCLGSLHGESVVMRELFARMLKLGPIPVDLVIEGETGTGKELAARTLHDLSERASGPFVTLDCSTLPSTLADATIFGFRHGAFTGAVDDQPGLIEMAHGGTLFIDEIGELTLELQTKFLRAVDRRQVSRLGENGVVRDVDVRILAATNRNLNTEVSEGRFRHDLYHRLGHTALRLPALRDRELDVIVLAEQLLRELAQRGEIERATIADDAKTLLMAYDWPGNVRELKVAIRRAAFICTNGVIKSEDIELGRPDDLAHKLAKAMEDSGAHKYNDLHMLVDRVYLPSVLDRCKSITAAAEYMGITRARLRDRLKALGLYDAADS